MRALPRVITHRPDLLGLTGWAYTDGRPHLAAWLDASEATGTDWHDPELVLIDVQCLDMMRLLYGERTGTTVALGADPADVLALYDARQAGRVSHVARTDRPGSLAALCLLLGRHRHPSAQATEPTPTRPALHLVRGGQAASMGRR